MILVARNVAEALADYAHRMEQTPLMKAAQTLPGYETYEHAIQSQYTVTAPSEDRSVDFARERSRDGAHVR